MGRAGQCSFAVGPLRLALLPVVQRSASMICYAASAVARALMCRPARMA